MNIKRLKNKQPTITLKNRYEVLQLIRLMAKEETEDVVTMILQQQFIRYTVVVLYQLVFVIMDGGNIMDISG